MRFIRRFSIALSGLLLLQLSLLGAVLPCAHGQRSGSKVMDASAPAASAMTTADAGREERPCGDPERHLPADMCTTAGIPCASMSSCGWAQATLVVPALAPAHGVDAIHAGAPPALHAGPTPRPELPPPRA